VSWGTVNLRKRSHAFKWEVGVDTWLKRKCASTPSIGPHGTLNDERFSQVCDQISHKGRSCLGNEYSGRY
jgi:hypothetical protein